MNPDVWQSDKQWVIDAARQIVACGELVYLDTETTGLGHDDEVVEVAVVDAQGAVVFESLVRPTKPIPAGATGVHGISDADVANAPTFAEILPGLAAALVGKVVVIYNKEFDLRLLRQSARARGIEFEHGVEAGLGAAECWCAMEAYAVFHGAWSDWHGSYTWQRLGNAMRQMRLALPEGVELHRARADAECTRLVVAAMAGGS